jgi:preprotein translocase subunit SecE
MNLRSAGFDYKDQLWRVAFGFRALIFLAAPFSIRRGLDLDMIRLTVNWQGFRNGATSTGRFTKAMTNPFGFLQEVRAEAAKVTWPSRKETMITTVLVLFMVVLASLFFVAVDWALRLIVTELLSLGH